MYIIYIGTLTAYYINFDVVCGLALTLDTPTTSGMKSQDVSKRILRSCLGQAASVVPRLCTKYGLTTQAVMPTLYLPVFDSQVYYCIQYYNSATKAGKPGTTTFDHPSSLAFIFMYSYETTQLPYTLTSYHDVFNYATLILI